MRVMIDGIQYTATLTTAHAAKPVLVVDGQAYGTLDVVTRRVELVQVEVDELAALVRLGYPIQWARVGCMERVCTCHDDHAWTYPGSYPDGCSSCGCHRSEAQP